ncbi:indolepyruvate ferredoxin oxidoreductase family protein [Sphingomonas oryzagri]|uniref:Indolepyruvate ferredoxin oxidoreductase family protein n=1 Tax=Sphingomonas oryzagri TaxID=3042314 RepID=A0ABT6MXL3_9SPHN|nr:indolepyruvate ferredoxin oxidoreductase family protein [Sphingomonas oryzagri]MDH7637741.1 indolepyruvate ferredoxin oxidoreductase family protein [Sphingomonas oryzagri]
MAEAMERESTVPAGRAVSLADKFMLRSGTVLISGVQALVRLMLIQAERDREAGLRTAGFVSGYRGSPLGTLDMAFGTAGAAVADHGIVMRPAVNEELAATMIAGTQQIEQSREARVDGVFALWYGKGPGVDRAADALRHANYHGSSPRGGVVLAVGDDHLSKSSSIVCNSDDVVAGIHVPLFYPADPAEIVEYGLHGFALSRHSGSYVALKIITEVADATRAVETDELALSPVLPDVAVPPLGLHNRWPDNALDQEARQIEHRLPAVAAYVRANRLDKVKLKRPGARIGLIAAGKSWLDLLEAMRLAGLDEARMAALGIALYKPAMIWPLEPEGLAGFADGLDTLIVIEEKGRFLESQIKTILYDGPQAPAVWGKQGPDGAALLPATGDITPERIAATVGGLIATLTSDEALATKVARADTSLLVQGRFTVPPALRKPFFCSGCPHNRSTVLPEGSRATGGIGCHSMATYLQPNTSIYAQMGGEGLHWVGLAPFTDEKHMFANMGDGTYFHSGILAIRQAVAAGTNITFKLLYNSAVAMTGGQSVDGELSVAQLVDQIRAEGVGTIVVSTDDPDRYPAGDPVRARVDGIENRTEYDQLQRRLRDQPGVSVIVYEQMCATEKRRLRKRGKLADPARQVFINELVCEGCGDCSIKSNCLSVEPVETTFGTKRRINQSSCNKDYSCIEGFCPSFVTVEGAKPRRTGARASGDFDASTLPLPSRDASSHERVVVAGVGGTGVVTIGALVAMAAHMGGRRVGVLDQVGMAQKGGAVVSHIHVADAPIHALRIPPEQASLVLVCDEIVGNLRDVMAAIDPGGTYVLANADVAITGDFTKDRDATPDGTLLARRLEQRAGSDHFAAYPFTRLSERLFGDAIGSNLMMVGFAWQKGWIAMDLGDFEAAVTLNATAVAMNKAAFAWGRRLAVDPDAVLAAAGLVTAVSPIEEDMVDRRAAFLADYQDGAYADRFCTLVTRVAEAEARCGGKGALARTVAKGLFRVMAYKDEYEVARLYTDGSFGRALADAFDGEATVRFHMAPPIFARRDKATGHLRKRSFGGWMLPVFRLLAKGRRLRGTKLDPFGYTAERRAERQLAGDYEALVMRIAEHLTPAGLAQADALAALVLEVRGYGHVKERAMETYRVRLPAAIEAFEAAIAAGTEAMTVAV